MWKKIVKLLMAVMLCLNGSLYFADRATAAKTTADFADLQDLDAATKAKFDAMIAAGIFDGVSEDKFGIHEEMNRAQFAKVAALIFNLKVDSSLKTSSFEDVKADDPANGYALPYIEAVKAAGITDGYSPGNYNPAGEVTKEQLAAFLVRGLDMNMDSVSGVNDPTVSDWAKGYVALALQKKLMSNGSDGTFGGSSAATRDLLLEGSYEAKEQFEVQAEEKKKAEEARRKKEEEEKKKQEEQRMQEEYIWYPAPDRDPDPVPEQEIVEAPTALPAGGLVTSGTQVTLTSPTVSATVYYTTDLSEPTTSSTLYTGPITITNHTTIKAIAVKPGATNSSVAAFDYTVTMPIVLPESIAPMTERQLYSGSVAKLSGGTGDVTYAVTNGVLPEGLTLNPNTGEITGTPSVSGAYHFTISATDSATPPATETMQYMVNITPAIIKSPLDLINEASESGEWGNVDEITFAKAGVTGVTYENLYHVPYYLDASVTTHLPLPRTSADIQSIINVMIQDMAVTEIYDYLDPFRGGSRPTVEVFTRAGITGVDDSNVETILDELRLVYQESKWDPFGTPMSTKEDIQNVVDRFII